MFSFAAHSLPVAMVGAVTAYVGVYHLGLQLKRKRQSDLHMAWSSLLVVVYDVAAFLAYNAPSSEAAAPYQRAQFVALSGLVFSFSRLLLSITGDRPPVWYDRGLWLFPALSVVGALERSGLVLSSVAAPRVAQTPWGHVLYSEVAVGPLFDVLLLGGAVTVLVPLVHAGRRGRRGLGGWWAATLFPIAGLGHDLLCSEGLLVGPYLGEYSWFAVVILVTWMLTAEVLETSRVRRTLELTENRFRTTLDAIQDAVITTDLGGTIAHLNPSAEQLLGVLLGDTLGAPLSHYMEIRSAETRRVVNDPVSYALARPSNPFGDLPQMVTTDGNERRVDIGGAPLSDDSGRVWGAVVVVRDLTVQHRALETLQHANKMESTGRLASGVAHDLNNLLTPIVSYAELLASRAPPDQSERLFLLHIQDAASRAADVTRQLLALSRRQVLDVQVVSLSDFLERTVPLVRQLVGENIKVDLLLDPEAGNVRIDLGQMEQVVLNLASNARDAMPEGGTFCLIVSDLGPKEVALEVKDDGTGMGYDVSSRIFEPFFTTKPRGKGTGLGLASVRGIVEQHGGTIYVDSEIGQGTSFEIILPKVEDGVAPSSPARLTPPRLLGGTEKLLVVEDEESVRTLIYDALTELGYGVRLAAGLAEAEALAREEKFDLLLTDIVMPEGDGPKVLEAVRKYQEVSCLFMTGHADDRLGERGFVRRGSVLLKPFSVSELGRKVREALDLARRAHRDGDGSRLETPP